MIRPTVLVVEDEKIVALDLESILRGLNYEVLRTASTASEAVRSVESNHPDLVLMDIRLQGGMDGIAAAEEIRRDFNVPVIFVTAQSSEKITRRIADLEASGYIRKPFAKDRLQAVIETALIKRKR